MVSEWRDCPFGTSLEYIKHLYLAVDSDYHPCNNYLTIEKPGPCLSAMLLKRLCVYGGLKYAIIAYANIEDANIEYIIPVPSHMRDANAGDGR